MTGERYDVALIPCTASKHPTGRTPLTLYKGGPFSLMIRHAQQRAGLILIMSAKYGLIDVNADVFFYNAYLPDLTPQARARLIVRLRQQIDERHTLFTEGRVLSYLSKAYFTALEEAAPAMASKLRRPYKKLPMLPLFKILSNEIKHYGQHPSRR